MKTITDITGNVYGRLTVVSFAGYTDTKKPIPQWHCECECGSTATVAGIRLRNGVTKSCGCLRVETAKRRSTKHGMKGTRAYEIWQGMKNRTTNPNNSHYQSYGGRGIKVCDEWLNSFETFLADMGEPPEGMSIDRIDNDGDYSKGNCQWATSHEQSRNRSDNVYLTANGETKIISDWAAGIGCTVNAIKKRLDRGWPVEAAVSIAPYSGNRYMKGVAA